jgi:hypothetical protein
MVPAQSCCPWGRVFRLICLKTKNFPRLYQNVPKFPMVPSVVAIGVHRAAVPRDAPRPILLIRESLGVVVSMGACFSADLPQDEEFPSPI